jgi:class 3 adenylate cyclase/CheY-like chemotaxis protein
VDTRTLTVLFTDLVGSTSAWSGLDPPAADRRRARHFALMCAAVGDRGGRPVKNLGDGLMAVFESVGDAMAAAGAMQRAFTAARRGGEPMLGLRVGLSTGDVTEEDDDAFGVPVVAASRLCARAGPGQVLLPAAIRFLLGATSHVFHEVGELELKGLRAPVAVLELAWDEAGDSATRVVLADDATLVREGFARLLESEGIEVVGQAGDALDVLVAVKEARPDVVVMDIRMPPNNRTDGLEAAEQLLAEGAGVGVLLLSTHLDATYARRLLDAGSGKGVGYLAKERVVDIGEFAAAVRRVAAGGTAFDLQIANALNAEPDR